MPTVAVDCKPNKSERERVSECERERGGRDTLHDSRWHKSCYFRRTTKKKAQLQWNITLMIVLKDRGSWWQEIALSGVIRLGTRPYPFPPVTNSAIGYDTFPLFQHLLLSDDVMRATWHTFETSFRQTKHKTKRPTLLLNETDLNKTWVARTLQDMMFIFVFFLRSRLRTNGAEELSRTFIL